jgi:Zn-dependent protease with chaperone function
MTTSVLWVDLATVAFLMLSLWIGLSVATAVIYERVRRYFDGISAASRRWQLFAVAALPMISATFATVFIFEPAISLPSDHCHQTIGCATHSPIQHGGSEDAWIFAVVAAVLLAVLVFRAMYAAIISRRYHMLLRAVTERHDQRGFWVVENDRPWALSAGLLKGEVFISAGLISTLDTAQTRVIVDHEAAHVRQRDNLTHFLIALLFCPMSAYPARSLLTDVRETAEQLADSVAAANSSADLVADTLVRVHRLGLNFAAPRFAYFNPTSLDRRVAALFPTENPRGLSLCMAALLVATGAASIIAGVDVGHHLLEAVIDGIAWVRAHVQPH